MKTKKQLRSEGWLILIHTIGTAYGIKGEVEIFALSERSLISKLSKL